MNTDPTRSSWLLPPVGDPATPAAAGRPTAGAGHSGDREKIAELAREFEAYFVLQLVRQMRQSMLTDESGQGLGAETMTDTIDVELGQQIARSGGIGLAQVLQAAIERQVGGSTLSAAAAPAPGLSDWPRAAAPQAKLSVTPPAPAYARGSASGPAGVGAQPAMPLQSAVIGGSSPHGGLWAGDGAEAAVPLPVVARLTSPFGWRSDPIDGATRFHAGVDIRAAYGREVPAAGAGEVVFSGAQGGYGNTVVIEHAGGVRTRYAHLSSIQVEAGQRVDAGAVVGRVGSSGRSTGPHLHFEVLQDGRPVNPAAAATRYASQLKLRGAVADLPISQPSVPGVAAGVDDEDSGQ